MPDSYAFDTEENLLSSLSKAQRDQLAQKISKRFSGATNDLRDMIEDSRLGWNYYLQNYPEATQKSNSIGGKSDAFAANKARKGLRLGVIPKVVDSVLAILHNSIFPADERFFRGTPKNDVALRYQELYEQFLSDNMAEDNTTEELRKFILTLCIDPAACVALPWKQRTRTKVVYEAPKITFAGVEIPVPVLGMKKKTIKDAVEWEGTKVECLDFNDWRVDPCARSMDESWFIRRWYMPTWQVERDYGLKDVKPYKDSVDKVDDPLGNQKRRSSGLVFPIDPAEEEEGEENALLMICYDDFVIDGKPYENHVAVTLNGEELVWFGPNPYNHGRIPYIVHALKPIPNQIYGQQLIKHAIPSAAAIDTAFDKTLKLAALISSPIFTVDKNEPAFRKSLNIKPGMTIPVTRPGSVQQVPIQAQGFPALNTVIEYLENHIREITGATSVMTGEDFSQQPANITAFQVDQHIQGASSRFQALMNNFNNNVLEPMLYMTHENFKQFMSEPVFVAVGDDKREVTPDLVKQLEFKWIITSAQAAQSRGRRLANLKSFATELAPMLVRSGVAQLLPETILIDQYAAIRDMLVLGGLPNADELVKKGPPPPPPPTALGGAAGPPMPQPGGMPPNGLPAIPPAAPPGAGPVPGPPQQ